MLPNEERLDARKARRGLWKPGPIHDELWDGDILDFREVELTVEELRQLSRRQGKRNSLPKTLQKLFSVASEKLTPKQGRFGGVDVITAKARLSEDFDEDDREEQVPIRPTSSSSQVAADRNQTSSNDEGSNTPTNVNNLSPSRKSSVRITYFDFGNTQNVSPPIFPSQRSNPGKVTRFEPSPPSEKSPSELLASSLAKDQSEEQEQQKKSSVDSQKEQNSKYYLPEDREDLLKYYGQRFSGIIVAFVFIHLFLFRITIFRFFILNVLLISGYVILSLPKHNQTINDSKKD